MVVNCATIHTLIVTAAFSLSTSCGLRPPRLQSNLGHPAYVHGDPIQDVDPTGLNAIALGGRFGGFLAAMPISLNLRAKDIARVGKGAAIALGGIAAIMLIHRAISLYGAALESGVREAADDASQYLALAVANTQSL